MKKYKTILSIFIIYIILNMLIFPKLYIDRTLDGISAWTFNVLPSILPFIFFTKLLSKTGTVEAASKLFAKPCKRLFKTPSISAFVFFISIISGYPVGAKMTADLYENGQVSQNDAVKMSAFCSTSGPMFIIGAVGASMLKNTTIGYIIFFSHVLGAICNGLLYRNLKFKEKYSQSKEIKNQEFSFSSIVLDSVLSILSVGAIIAIFFVIITSLSPIFNILPAKLSPIFEGIIEITKGCLDISCSLAPFWQTVACSFVISFGGISGLLQSYTMLGNVKISLSILALQKFSHAVLSAIIAIILALFLI